MSATLLNTAAALPDHLQTQEDVRKFVAKWLAGDPVSAAKADAIMANAGVKQRFTVRPLSWYLEHTSVAERSAVYKEEMIRLCETAATAALSGAGVPPQAVGLILSTSCTGLMIPSVEAHLINRMGFHPHTRRQPITTLGCAAGAAAIGQAATYLEANPEQAVLILSAELASLTGQVSDFSMGNIVSVALFGDGAAATVAVGDRFKHSSHEEGSVSGRSNDGRLPARVMATRSVLFPDTEDMMGFDLVDTGLKIFLSPRVPRFLRSELPRQIAPFLEENGLRLKDLTHFLLHPGGPKILRGLEKKLLLSATQTRLSWKILRNYGNLSSASVLFLLYHFEREETPQAGDFGLLLAVGPGFAVEMVLLHW